MLKTGDVVIDKRNPDQKMTVERIERGIVYACWFVDSILKRGEFFFHNIAASK